MVTLSKWTPTTDPMTLRRMGKLGEELGELQAVAARVVIQGIDEIDPSSGKTNRQRLTEESADVIAQLGCTIAAFDLDRNAIDRRTEDKIHQMTEWEAMFQAPGAGTTKAFSPFAQHAHAMQTALGELQQALAAMPDMDEVAADSKALSDWLEQHQVFLHDLLGRLGLDGGATDVDVLAKVDQLVSQARVSP